MPHPMPNPLMNPMQQMMADLQQLNMDVNQIRGRPAFSSQIFGSFNLDADMSELDLAEPLNPNTLDQLPRSQF